MSIDRSSSRSDSDKNLYEALQDTSAYSYEPEYVEHVQTHISHVFIAPPFVYKIKKPVDFGFLDYSTLEKRKHLCECEIKLNSRLCPDIYLGVVSIAKDKTGFQFEADADADVVEYAVKMKKLDYQYFLHSFIEENSLSTKHLDRVVEKLASFYKKQEAGPEILKYGEIERIKYNTDENFEQTEEFIGETIDREVYVAIQYFTNRYFKNNKPLFEQRVDEKRIVDGHGDLHLEHIHITPERVCIYDCIEFSERIRCGDWAVDLAFLAMDLDFNNCWQKERFFVQRMAEELDDPDLPKIIDFYKCYRAYVKGKVKSLQSAEEEVSNKDRTEARTKASRYFNLSLRYALLGSKPTVLVFMGRVGTGKSTLAEHLSSKTGIEVLSSDKVRKSMAGLPLGRRTPDSKREELYSDHMTRKVYNKLYEQAKKNIRGGESVILDATFSNHRYRASINEQLNNPDTCCLFIEATASDETLKSRLQARETEESVISDARLEDFKKLEGNYDPPEELDVNQLLKINTERKLSVTYAVLYRKLINRYFQRS